MDPGAQTMTSGAIIFPTGLISSSLCFASILETFDNMMDPHPHGIYLRERYFSFL